MTGQFGTLAAPLDPQLLPLDNYGGVVRTHALRYASQSDHSPAIDRGINPLGLLYDERNSPFDRNVTLLSDSFPETVDVGAYELQNRAIIVSITTWADADNPMVGGPTVSVWNTHSRITRIVFSFSQQVDIISATPEEAFSLKQMAPTGAGSVTLNVGSPTVDVTSITLRFTGSLTESADKYHSLKDGWYQLKAFADKIVSQFGEPIDGNNDGDVGDNFETPTDTSDPRALYRLFGDALSNDHAVAANDFALFRLYFNGSTPIFDFNGDGAVSGTDFIQFRLRFNGGI